MTRTSITLSKESLWKLKEVKVRLRCDTWDEFVDKLYRMIVKNNS